jgi:hypothetical protein
VGLVELAYCSRATFLLGKADIERLLLESRAFNAANHVTGVLVYKDLAFLQVIEGEEEVISSLYDRIRRDPRHTNVRTLFRRPLPSRHFANWTLAFSWIGDTSNGADGIQDLRTSPDDWPVLLKRSFDSPLSHQLLRTFWECA